MHQVYSSLPDHNHILQIEVSPSEVLFPTASAEDMVSQGWVEGEEPLDVGHMGNIPHHVAVRASSEFFESDYEEDEKPAEHLQWRASDGISIAPGGEDWNSVTTSFVRLIEEAPRGMHIHPRSLKLDLRVLLDPEVDRPGTHTLELMFVVFPA